jgi:hypothetical protein
MHRALKESPAVKEYDIFIPLSYNDGTPIERSKLHQLHLQLLSEFEGMTYFPQPNEGWWKMGNVLYQDEIVVFRVLSSRPKRARRYLTALKEDLKASLKQEEILIVERDVSTL